MVLSSMTLPSAALPRDAFRSQATVSAVSPSTLTETTTRLEAARGCRSASQLAYFSRLYDVSLQMMAIAAAKEASGLVVLLVKMEDHPRSGTALRVQWSTGAMIPQHMRLGSAIADRALEFGRASGIEALRPRVLAREHAVNACRLSARSTAVLVVACPLAETASNQRRLLS